MKALTSGPARRTILLKIGTKTITSDEEVANELALHFAKQSNGIYTNEKFIKRKLAEEASSIKFEKDDTAWYNLPFSNEEFNLCLSTSSSKSPGPDDIATVHIYQESQSQTQVNIAQIFQLYLQNRYSTPMA